MFENLKSIFCSVLVAICLVEQRYECNIAKEHFEEHLVDLVKCLGQCAKGCGLMIFYI